jgi:modulator of FtsH protease
MSSATAPVPAALPRDETLGLFGRTMALVSVTAAMFALGAILGRHQAGGWALIWFLVAFGALIAMNVAVGRSEGLTLGLLFSFGLFLGLAVASSVANYLNADPSVACQAGVATALTVVGFGAAGYAIRRDLSLLYRYLSWALLGLIGLGLALIFVQVPGGTVVYTVCGLVIFAGLLLVDFQRLRQSKDLRSAPQLAASLFLDVLNVFLLLLSLFSGDRG